MKKNKKVAIIGVGLLGGSLALALQKKKNSQVVGWNHRLSSRKKASRLLLVAPTIENAVAGADTIILCSHSSTVIPTLKKISGLIQKQTLIMDVSSVKGIVVKNAVKIRGIENHFVPCHPMAGKEKSGALNADAHLYDERYIFITPLPKSPKELILKAVQFWKNLGAIPVVMNAKTHDRNVALTSHLPHVLASAFVQLYGVKKNKSISIRQAVGSGFKDFTRIAASNPEMWSDILEMNSDSIRFYMSQYRRHLSELQSKMKKGNRRYWLSFFKKGKNLREKI